MLVVNSDKGPIYGCIWEKTISLKISEWVLYSVNCLNGYALSRHIHRRHKYTEKNTHKNWFDLISSSWLNVAPGLRGSVLCVCSRRPLHCVKIVLDTRHTAHDDVSNIGLAALQLSTICRNKTAHQQQQQQPRGQQEIKYMREQWGIWWCDEYQIVFNGIGTVAICKLAEWCENPWSASHPAQHTNPPEIRAAHALRIRVEPGTISGNDIAILIRWQNGTRMRYGILLWVSTLHAIRMW